MISELFASCNVLGSSSKPVDQCMLSTGSFKLSGNVRTAVNRGTLTVRARYLCHCLSNMCYLFDYADHALNTDLAVIFVWLAAQLSFI